MDGFTLSLATSCISLVMALCCTILWITHQQQRYLLDWACAGFLFFLSNLLTLFALIELLPMGLAPALVNITYICGHAAVLAGVRRQSQRSAHWDYILILALVIVLLHTTEFVQASIANRLVVFYPMLMGINAIAIWQLLTLPKPNFKKMYLPLLFAQSLFLLQLMIRFGLMQAGDQPFAVNVMAEWVMASGTLAVLVFLLLTTVGCVFVFMCQQEQQLRHASLLDPLTRSYNRRALDEVAPREFLRAKRQQQSLSMLLFDIDHFKSINDRFGHSTGDKVLQEITQITATELRGYDHLFRLGGEEFVALLDTVEPIVAERVAERIRQAVHAFDFNTESEQFNISISIGIANITHTDQDWQSMLHRADVALYQAKSKGRNRVCIAEPQLMPQAT